MGRVNSLRRLRYADAIGCDSADGTYIAHGPDINLPALLGWAAVRQRPGAAVPDEGCRLMPDTTPVETIRLAVTKMRSDAERCGDAPGSFVPAVADWLDSEARRADGGEGGIDCVPKHPLAVAAGYLGEAADHA
jgi:hypothetical protein